MARYAIVENGEVTETWRGEKTKVINGVTHPADVFTKWTDAELKTIGVYRVVEDSMPDTRFYTLGTKTYAYAYANDKVTETWGKTKRKVADIKATLIAKKNEEQRQKLAPTDWEVVRNAEKGTAIKGATTTARDALRTKGDSLETGINACTTHAQLLAVNLSWE